MYIYRAETWCDSCGERLRGELLRADSGPPDIDDEWSYDSDDFPKGPVAREATDGPDHCAAGADCLEGILLVEYGLEGSAEMFGAESHTIGALLSDGLTDDGVAYLAEMLREDSPTPYQEALHRYWRAVFADELAAAGEVV